MRVASQKFYVLSTSMKAAELAASVPVCPLQVAAILNTMRDTLQIELNRRCIRLFGVKCQWGVLKGIAVASLSITAAVIRMLY